MKSEEDEGGSTDWYFMKFDSGREREKVSQGLCKHKRKVKKTFFFFFNLTNRAFFLDQGKDLVERD